MRLYIMVGNIGSGKSTLVKKLLAKNPNIVVIARDALRYMIGGGDYVFNPKLEPTIFNTAEQAIEQFMLLGVDILVDETNMSSAHRKEYLTLARRYGYEAVAIVMPVLDKKTSVDRRMQNPHGQDDRALWEGVWDKFTAIYERPTEEEGFSQVSEVWEFNNAK